VTSAQPAPLAPPQVANALLDRRGVSETEVSASGSGIGTPAGRRLPDCALLAGLRVSAATCRCLQLRKSLLGFSGAPNASSCRDLTGLGARYASATRKGPHAIRRLARLSMPAYGCPPSRSAPWLSRSRCRSLGTEAGRRGRRRPVGLPRARRVRHHVNQHHGAAGGDRHCDDPRPSPLNPAGRPSGRWPWGSPLSPPSRSRSPTTAATPRTSTASPSQAPAPAGGHRFGMDLRRASRRSVTRRDGREGSRRFPPLVARTHCGRV
jgi:hypothetical protein